MDCGSNLATAHPYDASGATRARPDEGVTGPHPADARLVRWDGHGAQRSIAEVVGPAPSKITLLPAEPVSPLPRHLSRRRTPGAPISCAWPGSAPDRRPRRVTVTTPAARPASEDAATGVS